MGTSKVKRVEEEGQQGGYKGGREGVKEKKK
jgi:hypothetical protein